MLLACKIYHLSVLRIQLANLVEVPQFYLAVLVVPHLKLLVQTRNILNMLYLLPKLFSFPNLNQRQRQHLLSSHSLIQQQQARLFPTLMQNLTLIFLLDDDAFQELFVLLVDAFMGHVEEELVVGAFHIHV